MRKGFVILCLLLVLTAAVSADPVVSGVNSFQVSSNEGFIILNGLGFYQEQGGALQWKESLVIGDKVQVLSKGQKFKLDGKEREFIKVKTPSGNQGWVLSPYVVPKATLAVVKADQSIIYSEPRDVKITSKSVSNMTIVAVLQEGAAPGFSRILFYDIPQNAYYTDTPVYVATEDLTFSDGDINAVILYTTAIANKNKDIRSNLFKVIQKRYASTMFFDKIQAALSPAPAAPKPVVAASGLYTVLYDNVNVRKEPDQTTGEVLTRLNKGAQVEAVETTTQLFVVDGNQAAWFHIKEPNGWVFGAFLVPVQ